MQYYIDIDVLDDPEFESHFLMGALFNKFHRGLVKSGCQGKIAVSFPEYGLKPIKIGKKLRLHGNNQSLSNFMSVNWLMGMHDHVRCSAIKTVPQVTQYAQLKRKQTRSNVSRLHARFAKRHDISEEEAAKIIPITAEKRLSLPFISIKSQSTEQRFNLFIQQTHVENAATGEFNGYGLSQTATVPWF